MYDAPEGIDPDKWKQAVDTAAEAMMDRMKQFPIHCEFPFAAKTYMGPTTEEIAEIGLRAGLNVLASNGQHWIEAPDGGPGLVW